MRPRRSLAGVPFLQLLPLVVLLTTTPSSTASSADEDTKEGFTLAVVRRDSVAIPFATYDGKRWKNDWPMPQSRVTAPIAMTDVPKRWWTGRGPIAKWTLWPLDASDGASGASRTLETIGPALFPAHCQQGLGLRTTYSTREVVPPPHVQPYPKAGLAVSAGPSSPSIVPIEIVDVASSKLVEPLARTLVSAVYDEEKKIIAGYMRAGEGWTHPYKDEERKETPFRIEALYKVAKGLGDRDVYYFEGLKHYAIREPEPSSKKSRESRESKDTRASKSTSQNLQSTPTGQAPAGSQLLQSQPPSAEPAATTPTAAKSGGGPGQEPCDLVTFVSGWLIEREDELLKNKESFAPKQVRVLVTSCDFAAANIMLPLGVVRVKDKALWAVQWSNWTHEHYSVLDIKDEDFILAATAGNGGSCPPRP